MRKKQLAAAAILGAVVILATAPSPAVAQQFDGFVKMANLFWVALTAILGVVCMVSWIAAIGQYLSRGEQLGGYFWTAIGLAVGSTFLLGVEGIVAALSASAGGGATGTI